MRAFANVSGGLEIPQKSGDDSRYRFVHSWTTPTKEAKHRNGVEYVPLLTTYDLTPNADVCRWCSLNDLD